MTPFKSYSAVGIALVTTGFQAGDFFKIHFVTLSDDLRRYSQILVNNNNKEPFGLRQIANGEFSV